MSAPTLPPDFLSQLPDGTLVMRNGLGQWVLADEQYLRSSAFERWARRLGRKLGWAWLALWRVPPQRGVIVRGRVMMRGVNTDA